MILKTIFNIIHTNFQQISFIIICNTIITITFTIKILYFLDTFVTLGPYLNHAVDNKILDILCNIFTAFNPNAMINLR